MVIDTSAKTCHVCGHSIVYIGPSNLVSQHTDCSYCMDCYANEQHSDVYMCFGSCTDTHIMWHELLGNPVSYHSIHRSQEWKKA